MGYDPDSPPREERDEDDEDESEEEGGGNRLLGFMFGNVDDSGDLDADYLDEDAKEHLAAVADKLGTSLTDIELSVKSLKAPSDATDEDYDEKAENAVNYEDIDEQYEGPEIQAATEEDFLLPKKDFLTAAVSVANLKNTTSVYDDENYDDEDDDTENQNTVVEGNTEAPSISTPEEQKVSHELVSQDGNVPEDMQMQVLDIENLDVVEPDEHLVEQDDTSSSEDLDGEDRSSLLPILCVEDGKAILRFSEIFGVHQPIKKSRKRESRYVLPKDKYISMDASDTVEEDEEAFLKASFQDFPWRIPFHMRSEDDIFDDEVNSVTPPVVSGTQKMPLGLDEHKKDSCVSAEPLKDEASAPTLLEWNHISPNLYSLDQQNWEEKIIWSNSPSNSENFVESCELSGPDSDVQADMEMDFEVVARACDLEIHTEPHDKDHTSFLDTQAISVEPFGQNENSHSIHSSVTETRSHPQLLRLESRLDKDDTDTAGAKDKDTGGDAKVYVDSISHFSQLTLQNRDVLEGSWVDEIVWESNQSIMKPKLILDLQDEQMLFEISDTNDADSLQLHAGAMIISRSAIPNAGDSLELHGHGVPSAGRFNISNDKFYSNRKISQQLRSHSKKRVIHGLKVWHSQPALKLETMKAKLSNKDVANFHRPKASWYPHDIEVPFVEHRLLAMQGPMKIIVKSLGGRGSKLHVDAEETISSVKAKASKKLDFKPSELVKIIHAGRELEDSKSLAEQNVRPNSVLHLIRTKIHLLPRAQKIPGENKSLRPPGAFKKKSDLSVKDGRVFLMEYCEERPLLLGNTGMGARICTYYQKSTPGDQMGNALRNEDSGLGQVCILDTTDKSPFLGDIKPGSSQSCIETNMYRAPLFPHKVSSTDYLLVRSAKGKLSIRRIDRIHVVGQQEPHMEVMSPGSKNLQSYIMNRLLVYMYREFRASEKRGLRPSIRNDDLFSQFPSLSDAFLRKRLKNCADLQKGPNGQLLWVMKRNFRIPSEEELRRMVPPENVCSYESMQAGQYRLKRLGITKLTLPTGLSAAMNQLPDEAIALAAASHIERELQITPWNLSSNFVACTNQNRENLERLEISGVGDPSGRGLGFSYVRTTPKAPVANSVVKKKTIVAKGSTVTGTDADLRRLSMEHARELLLKFNVPDEHINRLTRWHRIAMIRKLSSDQAASGVKVDPTTVSKFARGQRMSFLQLQQQTREKCQEIWDRQIQSLCYAEVEENENESEANSDLDSFAGDLENLLDAEEGEEDNAESKTDTVDGVKGLKVRRRPLQTQAEEEIEDEAAEAAELRRMLMDEEEGDQKKKKTGAVLKPVGLAIKSKFVPEKSDGINKNNPFTKKTVQPAESFSSRDNNINDEKEEESMFPKRHQPGKLKVKKKNEIENTGLLNKKVLILADGMSVIKEKKSARDSFVCGACGQFGHMRTNKNCPRYGVDSETKGESTDLEKSLGRPNIGDQAESSQPKPIKKLVTKTLKSAVVEGPEDDKPNLKAKVLKVKCSGTDKFPDRPTPTTSQNSDRPMIAGETSNRSAVKVNKIIFSKKNKPDDVTVEPQKPSIVIKPPAEAERDQPRKKIIIKQPKEIINLDENSQDGSFGFDYRKTKKIVELSGLDSHREDERQNCFEETSRMRDPESDQWWVEDQNRNAERQQEERHRRSMKSRMVEEQPKLQILMYEEAIREEREEEAFRRQMAKNKKKKRSEMNLNYVDDLPPRRNDRRIAEKERSRKRPAVEHARHAQEYGQASKRRRGGPVGLSNILENIVEILRSKTEVSFLFLKPVTKKEAPDYYDVITQPMDLSKIRERARNLGYKNRQEFRYDVYLIVYNAHMYNDRRNPGIPPLADQLLELCDYLLEQHDAALTEAEEGID